MKNAALKKQMASLDLILRFTGARRLDIRLSKWEQAQLSEDRGFNVVDYIYGKANYCRAFEVSLFNQVKKGNIEVPVYLSAGQETIAATISTWCEINSYKPMIFAQHRAHSTYLSFGGCPIDLIDEILGLDTGCANGMGGSASIHSPEIGMFGHDGLMGSNIPIGVGACYASKRPVIVFAGDAAAEEDYAFPSYGWAATKKLPILFVVEDNDLSILTKKEARRSWGIAGVASSMGVDASNTTDHPARILEHLNDDCVSETFKGPKLINVKTNRKFWHAGAGTDGPVFDRLEEYINYIAVTPSQNKDYTSQYIDTGDLERFEKLWEDRLEIKSKIS